MGLKRIYIDRKAIKENDLRKGGTPPIPCVTIDDNGNLTKCHTLLINGDSWICHPDDSNNHHEGARLWIETCSSITAFDHVTGTQTLIK
jgi:hypothetical protein